MAGMADAGTAGTSRARGPVRVGIAGLGRSGWNIHARTMREFPEQFRIVAVADFEASRREEARQATGCRAYDSFEQLIRDDEIELVVVSTFNRLHAEHTVAALETGRHVVCEKPFALTLADADRSIATAERVGRHVIPFQNRRSEEHTSELQSRQYLVCRLLLEKKK